MRRRKPFTTAASAALCLLLSVAAVWLWAHEGHQALPTAGVKADVAKGLIALSPDTRKALDVQADEVKPIALDERVPATATIVAPWQRHAFATSRLAGKVTALHVQPGQSVKRGQPVADVDSLDLETLQLELLTAHNEAALSAKNLEQVKSGFGSGAVSARDFADAESRHQEKLDAVDVARLKLAGVGIASAALDKLLAAPKPAPIRTLVVASPLDGVVSHVDVAVGQVVEPADHLLEVADLSRVWVRLGVLEKDLHRVHAGQGVEMRLTAFPAETFTGTLQPRGLVLDAQTHLGEIWTELDNPERRLLPGMFGQAEIRIQSAQVALAIPAAALIADGAERYVLIEEGPGQYRRQFVWVQRHAGDVVQVAANRGLFPGDRVATAGSHELAASLPQSVLKLSAEAERRIGLRVEPARPHAIAEIVTVSAAVELRPGRKAVVASRLAGALGKIAVARDQPVRAGDVVAEIVSPELHNLQLELLRSHLQVRLLAPRVAALGLLIEGGSLSLRTFRETESALATARLRRDSLRRKLLAVGLSEEQIADITERRQLAAALPVHAPIAGEVVRLKAALGQAVKAEETLFEVHDPTEAGLRLFVPEAQAALVKIGQQARVRLVADPGFVGEAVVERLGPAVNAADHTLSAWAAFKSPPNMPLQEGMLARVHLVVAEPAPVLAAPASAIWREGGRVYVFVRKPDGAFERRELQTGRADDRFVEVPSGLRDGESMAVSGVPDLQTAFASLR